MLIWINCLFNILTLIFQSKKPLIEHYDELKDFALSFIFWCHEQLTNKWKKYENQHFTYLVRSTLCTVACIVLSYDLHECNIYLSTLTTLTRQCEMSKEWKQIGWSSHAAAAISMPYILVDTNGDWEKGGRGRSFTIQISIYSKHTCMSVFHFVLLLPSYKITSRLDLDLKLFLNNNYSRR